MRLPDNDNPKLIELEDARQFHEKLYAVYLDNPAKGCVFVPATEAGAGKDLVRLSGNLHRFWTSRGFRLNCAQAEDGRDGVLVWLTLRAKARVEQAA